MKATAEKLEKNTVMLEVEVEPEKFSEAVNQAYKKIVTKVNIPGFRKGKAPRVILERYIRKEALYDEAVEIVIPDAYLGAVVDTGIEPVAQPEVELVQVEEGKALIFKAKVVVKPEVSLGQYTELEVEQPVFEITDEDVQQELERLQNRHAKLITVEEGTIVTGDSVVIDFEGKIENVPFEGGKAENYTLEIGSGTFIPGFEDAIVGMTINETKDIDVTFPEDYGNEELAGKPAVFTVTVKSIKRKELSALDDEFAKDVSEFDTLEELRTDLTNRLKQAAEDRAQTIVRNRVLDKAVENAEAEIPTEMIDTRVEEMIQNMGQRLSMQGISLESYLSYTNSSEEELKERVRPDAEKSVRQMLVLEAIAKKENLSISEEELAEEIKRMGEEMKQEPDMVRKFLEAQDQVEFVKDSMLKDKTVDFLVDKAVLVKEAEDTKDSKKE